MKQAVTFLLSLYKKTFSKVFLLVLGNGCRYTPTCSEYAKDAIASYGIAKGIKLSLKRVARCHPFAKGDYFDPVPVNY